MPRSLLASALILLLVVVGCVGCVGGKRLDAMQALSDESRALYAKYRQFMTEGQQDAFLAQPDDEARAAYVKSLRIEERLAKYPAYVQEAIWAQEVVPGMDNEAVLLSWGLPERRDWDEQERVKGNDVQRWQYTRYSKLTQVVIANGVVTQVLSEP